MSGPIISSNKATRLNTFNEVLQNKICVLLRPNAFGKGMYLFVIPPPMGKL